LDDGMVEEQEVKIFRSHVPTLLRKVLRRGYC
jgi:hypothetical protein